MHPPNPGKNQQKDADSALSNRRDLSAGRTQITPYFAISYGQNRRFRLQFEIYKLLEKTQNLHAGKRKFSKDNLFYCFVGQDRKLSAGREKRGLFPFGGNVLSVSRSEWHQMAPRFLVG